MSNGKAGQFFQQPASVWAITFATAMSFMGIGLVSPILPTISDRLEASAFESMLLFTSYLFVTATTMFFAGYISSRFGIKTTLTLGLSIIVVFSSMAGLSDTIGQIIGLRAGWGFGNALFVTMALAGIVGTATGGAAAAIMLYEAALGLGMALGPLLGGTLGTISWRAPFLGTALLMAIAAITVAAFVKPLPKQEAAPISVGFTALRHKALLLWSVSTFCFNFTIVCILAYAPHAVANAAQASGVHQSSLTLGMVFFGWGTTLAVFSLTLPRLLLRALGLAPAILVLMAIMGACFLVLALNAHNFTVVVLTLIILGGFQGATGALLTQAALTATQLPRNIASASFSALRFFGGAIFPLVSAPVIALYGAPGPFWGSLIALGIAGLLVALGFKVLPVTQRQRSQFFSKPEAAAQTQTP